MNTQDEIEMNDFCEISAAEMRNLLSIFKRNLM